jgi:hypothetical protein
LFKIGANRREESVLTKKDTFTTMMANYFSVGECAKIGFDFEVNRTNSKCGNIIRYACSGLKFLCCSCCCWKTEERIPIKQQLKYTSVTSPSASQTENEELLEMKQELPKSDQNEAPFSVHFKQEVTEI